MFFYPHKYRQVSHTTLSAFKTFTALIWDFSLRALTIANLYVIFEEHFYNRLIHASILRYIAKLLSCQSEETRGEKQLSTFKQETKQTHKQNAILFLQSPLICYYLRYITK